LHCLLGDMRPARRRTGFSLVIVMGVLVIATVGAAATLAVIGREASLQGVSRRDAEAFFAAEAGLAEGRERVRLLAEGTSGFTSYSSVMQRLTAVPSMGANGETWYEVLPSTPYELTASGTSSALDPNVTTASRELRDETGARFADYPLTSVARYRVFLRDDRDDAPNDPSADANGQVWLVSVGEVLVGSGQPVRRVTQALVNYRPGSERIDCSGQKGGCADKTNGSSLDARTPTVTGVLSL
jgi:hypothetical protein